MNAGSPEVLWKKIKEDHVRSFEKLYQLTYKKLGNLCYKIVADEEAAQDILQECYVSLYQRKDQLPDDLNVEAYLYASVKFSSFKYLRDVLSKKQAMFVSYRVDPTDPRDEEYLPEQEDWLSEDCQREDYLEADHLMDHVLGSIAELPERCRNAFVLKYINNLSYREISEKMQISPKTVEKHVHYGLNILRKKFRKSQDKVLLIAVLACMLIS